MRRILLVVPVMAFFSMATTSAQDDKFVPKRGKEGVFMDLAGGIAVKIARTAPTSFAQMKTTGVPLAVQVTLKGPPAGFGVMTAPSTDSKASGVKLHVGGVSYAPRAVEHPQGSNGVHKTERLGNSVNFLQARMKGQDRFDFLFDVPASSRNAAGNFEILLLLGMMLEESKGDFRISVALAAAP